MTEFRSAGRIAGALFLAALVLNGVGSELAEAGTGRTPVLTGELLELLCGAAVVGVGAVSWAAFRRHSPGLATAYLGFRIAEAAVNAMIVVSTLTALGLTGELREAWLDQRYQSQLVYIHVFAAGAAVWYGLLYRTRAVPRFVAGWGLAGLAVLLAGALADMFGHHADMVLYGLPLGLNELFLGGWLLVRGFRDLDARPDTPAGLTR